MQEPDRLIFGYGDNGLRINFVFLNDSCHQIRVFVTPQLLDDPSKFSLKFCLLDYGTCFSVGRQPILSAVVIILRVTELARKELVIVTFCYF